jgi:hypothetical protein
MPDDELVDDRLFPRPGAEETSHPLHMLPLAQPPRDDDPDLGVGDVETFVEHLGGHQSSNLASAEASQSILAFPPADVAGERHDEVFAGYGVGRLVVGHEHQSLLFAMTSEQQRQRLALAAREREQPPRPAPRRHAPPPFIGLRGVMEEIFPGRAEMIP